MSTHQVEAKFACRYSAYHQVGILIQELHKFSAVVYEHRSQSTHVQDESHFQVIWRGLSSERLEERIGHREMTIATNGQELGDALDNGHDDGGEEGHKT